MKHRKKRGLFDVKSPTFPRSCDSGYVCSPVTQDVSVNGPFEHDDFIIRFQGLDEFFSWLKANTDAFSELAVIKHSHKCLNDDRQCVSTCQIFSGIVTIAQGSIPLQITPANGC